MNTSSNTNKTHGVAQDNLAFSLMGRMHVILRRQNERVTDIEYMRIDPKYCRHILDLALRLPHEDLHAICVRLDEICFGQDGMFAPLLPAAPPTPAPPPSGPGPVQNPSMGQTYIGRLR